MQQAMGIQTTPGPDPANPIPPDGPTGDLPVRSVTSTGQIQLVGNNGTDNAITISLSALQLTGGTPPQTEAVNLPFNTVQQAQGQTASTDVIVYDSLGIPLTVNITCVLQQMTSSYTEYRWFADCGQNDPGGGSANIAVGTGLVQFDGDGNFMSATNDTVSIGRANEPSVKPLQFNLNFSSISGLATSTASLAVTSQDGSAPGTLSSYQIGQDGTISGVFSNGISRDLGQIVLAQFQQSGWSGTTRPKHVLCGRELRLARHRHAKLQRHRFDRGWGIGIVQRRRGQQLDQPDYGLDNV